MGLKPSRYQRWLNPDVENLAELNAQVKAVCKLYEEASQLHSQGTHVISTDEMTGIQASERVIMPMEIRHLQKIAFSPDGKTITSHSYDNTVKLRSVKLWSIDGRELRSLTRRDSLSYIEMRSATLSPDGKTLASGSWDNTVKLWSIDGKELQSLTGHTGPVMSVAFSPDGKTIASAGSFDNTVKLWSIDGKELQSLKGHSGRVWSVAFSPDGKTIASGSSDNTVKLWSIDGKLQFPQRAIGSGALP